MSKKDNPNATRTPARWRGLGKWLRRGDRTVVEGWTYNTGSSRGRRGNRSKHARVEVRRGSRTYQWRPTKRPPWVVRAENRRRNRASRRARRVNRRR